MDFIENVKRRTDLSHFQLHKDGLDKIPVQLKSRYLQTLDCCGSMPGAYDILYKGRNLPDKNYERFLQFMSGRQVSPNA